MQATADLVSRINPAALLSLGDHQYEDGTLSAFQKAYDAIWGRFKAITHPATGNHEYNTPHAAPYYSYFGTAAGDPTKGYYSFDLGAWHIVVLNSTCNEVAGCYAGSPQEQWLRADLAAHPAACTMAYWHHPRFSSGEYGDDPTYHAFWQALYEYHVDVVLNGHEHDYERFALQNPDGRADSQGIREFIIGTGGKSQRPFGNTVQQNSEVRETGTYGVMQLTLHPTGYDWQFVPEAGKTFTDTGTTGCHGRTATSPPAVRASTATPTARPTPRGAYPAAVLADHPVSYWRMGEASTTVADYAGDNPGTSRGGVTAGDPGAVAAAAGGDGALTFAGTGSVSVPQATSLNITGDLTLEAWAKPAELGNLGEAIVQKSEGDNFKDWQYRLARTADGHWRGTVYIRGGTYNVTDPGTPAVGRWDHLVLTRRGEALTFYVNGVVVATAVMPNDGKLNVGDGNFAIGRAGSLADNFFQGAIDEVAIYNTALSPERVLAHYQAAGR